MSQVQARIMELEAINRTKNEFLNNAIKVKKNKIEAIKNVQKLNGALKMEIKSAEKNFVRETQEHQKQVDLLTSGIDELTIKTNSVQKLANDLVACENIMANNNREIIELRNRISVDKENHDMVMSDLKRDNEDRILELKTKCSNDQSACIMYSTHVYQTQIGEIESLRQKLRLMEKEKVLYNQEYIYLKKHVKKMSNEANLNDYDTVITQISKIKKQLTEFETLEEELSKKIIEHSKYKDTLFNDTSTATVLIEKENQNTIDKLLDNISVKERNHNLHINELVEKLNILMNNKRDIDERCKEARHSLTREGSKDLKKLEDIQERLVLKLKQRGIELYTQNKLVEALEKKVLDNERINSKLNRRLQAIQLELDTADILKKTHNERVKRLQEVLKKVENEKGNIRKQNESLAVTLDQTFELLQASETSYRDYNTEVLSIADNIKGCDDNLTQSYKNEVCDVKNRLVLVSSELGSEVEEFESVNLKFQDANMKLNDALVKIKELQAKIVEVENENTSVILKSEIDACVSKKQECVNAFYKAIESRLFLEKQVSLLTKKIHDINARVSEKSDSIYPKTKPPFRSIAPPPVPPKP